MTIEEKVKEAENLIAKANKLLEEVKQERETIENDILASYYKSLENDCYWLDSEDDILYDTDFTYNDIIIQHSKYCNYPSREYVEQAQKMKELNDKLLAFKWCYDREYEPIFDGDYCNTKYAIYYDSLENKYVHDYTTTQKYNLIYFSSKEIAKKCCDWLNNMKENDNE